jgi:hypothetical protein
MRAGVLRVAEMAKGVRKEHQTEGSVMELILKEGLARRMPTCHSKGKSAILMQVARRGDP